MERIESRKELKRDRIIKAAIHVINTQGYSKATIGHIIHEAGVSRSAFYRFFSNKQELVDTIFDQLVMDYSSRFQRMLQKGDDPVETLIDSCMESFNDAELVAEYITIYFELWASGIRGSSRGLNKKMRLWMERYSRAHIPLIKEGQRMGLINPDMDPHLLIRTIFSALDGLVLHYAIFRPSPEYLQKQRVVLKKMIRGILQCHIISEDRERPLFESAQGGFVPGGRPA